MPSHTAQRISFNFIKTLITYTDEFLRMCGYPKTRHDCMCVCVCVGLTLLALIVAKLD